MPFYSRKNTRIPGYDYSSENYYFITICTHGHQCIFGQPSKLNHCGKIVQKHIERLSGYYQGVGVDKYVVMPNHIHMILILDGRNHHTVSSIIGSLKSSVTKEIRESKSNMSVWQRSFHDHIIRNQKSYEKIWLYIEDNPRKWEEDCFYSKNNEKIN